MLPHERFLDFFADQLRKDTLDETTSIDPLLKAIQFFQVSPKLVYWSWIVLPRR